MRQNAWIVWMLIGCGGSVAPSDGATGTDSGSMPRDGGGTPIDGGRTMRDAGPLDPMPIGEWTDAPGQCPPGTTQVDLRTVQDIHDASRGDGAFTDDAADTCYFIHDGTYTETGTMMFVAHDGAGAGHPKIFVGESRDGVVLHARASIGDDVTPVSDVTISNMTFDLDGYTIPAGDSFNTINIAAGSRITIDHVTLTGNCTVGHRGGHIEVNGATTVLIDSCLIEQFGACGPAGHEDHGIYLSAGNDITVRNNVIRENASRGIQMYTQGGEYGMLDGVVVELNRIYANGHADYEDGIVINGTMTGTIANVAIRRNLFYDNYYSGIRQAGDQHMAIVVEHNTFDRNGARSTGDGRSEINLDGAGTGADTMVQNNVFAVGNAELNDCYDSASRGFHVGDNFVQGSAGTGACIDAQTMGDPQFADAASGDYHTGNAAAAAYGAYAP